MYKVLIADDELREINIIKILLDKQWPSTFKYIEAKNGDEAYGYFISEKPQLAFLDIRMPGFNGIEAARRMRDISKDVYIIIITAYNYFEFAKEAIHAGVNDFILKPPSRDSINEAIQKFFHYEKENSLKRMHELETREKLDNWMNIMQKEITISLAYGNMDQEHVDEYFKQLKFKYTWGYCALLDVQNSGKRIHGNEDPYEKFGHKKLLNSVNLFLRNKSVQFTSTTIGKKIILFIFIDEKNKSKCDEIILNFIRDLIIHIEKTHFINLKAGIGGGYLLINELSNSYKEALSTLSISQNSIIRKSEVCSFKGREQGYQYKDDYYVKYLVKQVREGHTNSSIDTLVEAFSYFESIYGKNQSVFKIRTIDFLSAVTKACIDKKDIFLINELSILLELDEASEMMDFSQKYIKKLLTTVEESKCKKRHFAIDRAIEYVNENYYLQISVEEFCTKFSMTPFYFSRLFKEYQNMNFIDYLTEVRINKAIALLKDGAANIKEIAYKVGYNDPNYFSRVFKKITGISPKDYRNQI